jgi:hypothetical protein
MPQFRPPPRIPPPVMNPSYGSAISMSVPHGGQAYAPPAPPVLPQQHGGFPSAPVLPAYGGGLGTFPSAAPGPPTFGRPLPVQFAPPGSSMPPPSGAATSTSSPLLPPAHQQANGVGALNSNKKSLIINTQLDGTASANSSGSTTLPAITPRRTPSVSIDACEDLTLRG